MFEESPERRTANYSLQADLLTGWKPKLKIIGPMPLNFDNPKVDRSIMSLVHQESAFYEVVFMGLRPLSTFKMQEALAKNYKFKYLYLLNNDFAHLKPFYKKFYSLFEPELKRPFCGMNPNISRKQLIFESQFQSGNLDCVVRLKSLEYDLVLRVDSNTSGHVMWYYFRVRNPQSVDKTVKFNIVNLKRCKSAYQRGMKPYIKRSNASWQQQGEDVELIEEKLRYHKQNFAVLIQQNQQDTYADYFRKLTFKIDLKPLETVEIAYCIPYTYTQLLEDIKNWRGKAEMVAGLHLEVDLSNESLSGLEIPIVKIHYGPAGNGKYCIFMIGRQHPGESNSSFVIKGTIQQLLNGEQPNLQLLRQCDFVVIPMLNPDGVVAGNFRTSLFGKDLNRLFKVKDTTLLPQIQLARGLFSECSDQYKKKLLLFLDYHGHSTRKNAFFLGPGIFDAQLINDIRILPKIIASYSQIFRYPSCSFRLQESKKTTARALFGKFAGLSYTIEASNWSYYSKQLGAAIDFTEESWIQLGSIIMKGVQQFIKKKLQARKKYDKKMIDDEARRMKLMKSRQQLKLKAISEKQTQLIIASSSKSKEIRIKTEAKLNDFENEEQQQFIDQGTQKNQYEVVKQVNQSDEMSQNGMDTDGQQEDMQNRKFQKYIKAASEMLVEFEKVYYGDSYKKAASKYKMNSNSRSNKLLMKEKKKKIQPIQACLRVTEPKKIQVFERIEDFGKEFKKKLFLEDEIIRDTLSKAFSERKDLNFQVKNRNQPDRKAKIKIVGQIFREPNMLNEQIQKFQKLQKLYIDQQSKQRRREQQALSPKSYKVTNPLITSNSASIGLPFIRELKNSKQKVISNTSNLMGGPKSMQRMSQMLNMQQKMNKSTVLNVLRLSRIQMDPHHYF